MSLEATRWAWQQPGITATQKLVLLALADRAADRGEEKQICWPSQERISKDTGLTTRAIRNAITALENMGLVCRVTSERKVNTYRLLGVSEDTSACPEPLAVVTPIYRNVVPPCRNEIPPSYENVVPVERNVVPTYRNDVPPESIKNLSGNNKESAHPRTTHTPKQPYGEFHNVKLTAEEYESLVHDYGENEAKAAIDFLDLHLGARKGADPYKSHNLAMRKWVFQKLAEDRRKLGIKPNVKPQAAAPSAGKDFFERMEEIERRCPTV